MRGSANHMSTWVANLHKEFHNKPNKRLKNVCKPIAVSLLFRNHQVNLEFGQLWYPDGRPLHPIFNRGFWDLPKELLILNTERVSTNFCRCSLYLFFSYLVKIISHLYFFYRTINFFPSRRVHGPVRSPSLSCAKKGRVGRLGGRPSGHGSCSVPTNRWKMPQGLYNPYVHKRAPGCPPPYIFINYFLKKNFFLSEVPVPRGFDLFRSLFIGYICKKKFFSCKFICWKK